MSHLISVVANLRLIFTVFSKLVDPQVTSFEPVSRGNLIEGLQFHKFYFDNGKRPENSANSIAP